MVMMIRVLYTFHSFLPQHSVLVFYCNLHNWVYVFHHIFLFHTPAQTQNKMKKERLMIAVRVDG